MQIFIVAVELTTLCFYKHLACSIMFYGRC